MLTARLQPRPYTIRLIYGPMDWTQWKLIAPCMILDENGSTTAIYEDFAFMP